ncbi:MAG: pyruvate kinase alpha/beta domain-containing protein, partial [Candidatus Bathyarchaeia archaeon]
MKSEKISYFDAPGKQNTDATLKAALEKAKSLGVKDIIVASTTGETGVKACEVFRGFNVVVVTTHVGS